MVLASAPKGYNLDKILEFLAAENTIFMIYLVGIDYEHKTIKTKLISMFQETLIDNTVYKIIGLEEILVVYPNLMEKLSNRSLLTAKI
jgi:hypothetical protein